MYYFVCSDRSFFKNFSNCGKFHFKVVWPEFGFYAEWYQTSNPLTTETVTGFEAVYIKVPSQFRGLNIGSTSALIFTHGDNGHLSRVGATSLSSEQTFTGPGTRYA